VLTFVVPFGSSNQEEVSWKEDLEFFSNKVQKDLVVTEER
jgi:hypothetical protein